MTVPTSIPFAQLLCRLYADGKVKPSTTFTYLAPASHRARANAAGRGFGEGSRSAAQPSCLSDVLTSGVEPAGTPIPACTGDTPTRVGLPSVPDVNRF